MPSYRRRRVAGGTYFFTVVTHRRVRLFAAEGARHNLRRAIEKVRDVDPFEIEELVLLLDHFHLILTLPPGDADFSTRIGRIKSSFTRLHLEAGGTEIAQTESRDIHRYRGVWQQRFWEHHLRDENDLGECRKYCWYNPVKHGLVDCPHRWPYSTFHRAVRRGWIDNSWCCRCGGAAPPARIRDLPGAEMD